jgi:hypothetical protein
LEAVVILVGLFLACGGTAYAVSRAAPAILVVIAGTLLLWYPMAGIMWLNDRIGTNNFIVHSWQSLSGVNTPGEVYQQCGGSSSIPSDTLWGVALVVCLWALSAFLVFFDIFLGFGAIVGIPIGLVATALGALGTLALRTKDALLAGLTILVIGLGCMVAMGLAMRVVHFSTGIMC